MDIDIYLLGVHASSGSRLDACEQMRSINIAPPKKTQWSQHQRVPGQRRSHVRHSGVQSPGHNASHGGYYEYCEGFVTPFGSIN